MNLIDGAFLCLDIGTRAVHAFGLRVSMGKISSSAFVTCESDNTAYAIKTAADALEEKLSARFDSAFVTGNFGRLNFDVRTITTNWDDGHQITASDIAAQINEFFADADAAPLHIIPLRYDLSDARNIQTPIGQIDSELKTTFGVIAYDNDGVARVKSALRTAHMRTGGMYDAIFLLANTLREKNETAVFAHLGAQHSTVALWTPRGPVFMDNIPFGGELVTSEIAAAFNLTRAEADRLKRSVANAISSDEDRFTLADDKYEFSRAEINDFVVKNIGRTADAALRTIAANIDIDKYNPTKIYISGGGAEIQNIGKVFNDVFRIPAEVLSASAPAQALSSYIWKTNSRRAAALARGEKKRQKFIETITAPFRIKIKKRAPRAVPIMPSTLAFDMNDAVTYAKFQSGNISTIHVDIMDGFYVPKSAGSIDDLRQIRARTRANLHTHLMVENPLDWIKPAADAGADTIIVSAGTYGVKQALSEIRELGRRNGIAVNPSTPLSIISPVLRDVDDVLVMSVEPGAAGQKFIPEVLLKVTALAAARKKYNLKFRISVDGGITPSTAKQCFAAGADALVSGSYLAAAPDFAAAVQSLL